MREPSSDRLLREYARGDFFFATAERTLLAAGARDVLADTDEFVLAEHVRESLRANGGWADTAAGPVPPVAVGALPFASESGHPGRIVLPASARFAGPAHPAVRSAQRRAVPPPASVRPVPEPARHIDAVAYAVAALGSRDLRKVVLARALDLEFAEAVAAEAILHNLVLDNERGYTFAAQLPGSRTLLGSSPELLLSRRGDHVVSHPHAGSAPRSADPETDRKNGHALLASAKDHIEHTVLTDAVVEALRPYCRSMEVPAQPRLVSTPTMWHLGTTITGELLDRDVTALHLAAALHPTPAICGTPTGSARRLVTELEEFERNYYAGTVGWVDAEGDGEWAVSIRCAEVARHSLRLYAGGGIVPESDPKAELTETSAKFATLLRAMGLPQE